MILELQKQIKVVRDFESLLNGLDEILEQSPLKMNFLIEKLEMTKSTFYNKKRNRTFTIDQLKGILELLDQVD